MTSSNPEVRAVVCVELPRLSCEPRAPDPSRPYFGLPWAAVVAPIAGIVALKVAYLLRYNSEPPAGFKTTDRTFTTGIQITP